jgi:arylsulfatase
MLGQRSLYHQGWLASTVHPPLSGWGNFSHDEWELYHLAEDRSQTRNVAADHPDRLAAMRDLWFYQAGINKGLPLDDRTALEQVLAERPKGGPDRSQYTYYPHCADVPEMAGASVNGRSFTIVAGVIIEESTAEGVLYAHGGVAGGHSLYLLDGSLRYTFNWVGTHIQDVVAPADLSPGRHLLTAEFQVEGPSSNPQMPGMEGDLTLFIDEQRVATGRITTQPGNFCLVGDGICVGRDSASPVTPAYADRGMFEFSGGTIERVIVDVTGEHFVDHEAQVRAWLLKD